MSSKWDRAVDRFISQMQTSMAAFKNEIFRGDFSGVFRMVETYAKTVANAFKGKVNDPDYVNDDGAALGLGLGGEAIAFGEDTDARGHLKMELAGGQSAVVAIGSSKWYAEAQDPKGPSASAFATTAADWGVANADLVFTYEIARDSGLANSPYSASSTELATIAIDLKGFDFANGMYVDGVFKDGGRVRSDRDVADGNYAQFEGQLTVFGRDTTASITAEVLAIEDALSEVTAIGFGAGVHA